jgi:ectoine hydroxylase-related dioxygenase (phytanoyl-CoA dioxygenase family)
MIATQTKSEAPALSVEQTEFYQRQGYLIVRHMFSAEEVAALRKTFDDLAAAGKAIPGLWEPQTDPAKLAQDPLARYPRVMHPHRFDALSLRVLLDRRMYAVLRAILGEEPIAAQSMFYYKPPGARGQALHQDNFYLEVKPGSCIAAWLAIDPSRPENGGLSICPGTHQMEVVCPERADEHASFTTELVKPPPGCTVIPATLEPGDCLFFHGSVIHGSQPNRTRDLWRRSFICHYMPKSARQIARHYFPLHDFDGHVVEYPASPAGGPCGNGFKPSSYDQVP